MELGTSHQAKVSDESYESDGPLESYESDESYESYESYESDLSDRFNEHDFDKSDECIRFVAINGEFSLSMNADKINSNIKDTLIEKIISEKALEKEFIIKLNYEITVVKLLIPVIREGKLIIPPVHFFHEFSRLLSYLASSNKIWAKYARLLSSRYIFDIFGNEIDIGLPEFVGRTFNKKNEDLYDRYSKKNQLRYERIVWAIIGEMKGMETCLENIDKLNVGYTYNPQLYRLTADKKLANMGQIINNSDITGTSCMMWPHFIYSRTIMLTDLYERIPNEVSDFMISNSSSYDSYVKKCEFDSEIFALPFKEKMELYEFLYSIKMNKRKKRDGEHIQYVIYTHKLTSLN